MKKNVGIRLLIGIILLILPAAIIHAQKGVMKRWANEGMKDHISDYGFTTEMVKSDSAVDAFGKRLIERYSNETGVHSANVKIYQTNRGGGHFQSVWYQQTVNGVPVDGSEIGISIGGTAGDIISFGTQVFPDVQCATSPAVSATNALSAAERDFGGKKFDIHLGPTLCILPEESAEGYTYKLAWKMDISRIDTSVATYRYFVSAENGSVLQKENLMRHDLNFVPKGKEGKKIRNSVEEKIQILTQPIYEPAARDTLSDSARHPIGEIMHKAHL